MPGVFKYKLGINEFSSNGSNLLKSLLAEFIGLLLINLFGIFCCLHGTATMISFTFGLIVFMVVASLGHVSGAHVNPAITVGLLAVGKISFVRALLYIVAQCAGAVAGTGCVKALIPEAQQGTLGMTRLAENVLPMQGLGMEFFLGFVLVLTVFGVVDDNKPDSKIMAPLAIGMTVVFGHLAGIKYTGASMNPARTFGSALLSGIWENHWIYWVGPILGGVAAALLYVQTFVAPEPEVDLAERYRTHADEKEMARLDGKRDLA
ncbi:aquaporin AQPAn.G-like [Phlebotomus argentipes]|uniref:aquaporin AQPAn.G-like n=1 Tax=Phlebotomus argentipes TaxID=94469 RepID=UPI0028938087|nr:aquaporin AQPAn.G-like [Phlebotomus argentipes]